MPPDIEVEQDPAAVAAGKDPQLDRAIEVVLEALAKNPPPKAPPAPAVPGAGAREGRRASEGGTGGGIR